MDSFYITLRVMEVMLNLVDTLMEVGVHKNWQSRSDDETHLGGVDPLLDYNKDKDTKVKVIFLSFRAFMCFICII